MTAKTALRAKRREETGKGAARRIRSAGQVPAVLYGKDQESVLLTLNAREALRLFHSISVENTIVNVLVDEEEWETLVREIQMHPFRPDIVHVDFFCIERGVALEVDIPVNYVGTPKGVRDGGVLEIILHEFRVKCLPSKIPESIEIEVIALEIGDSIHVGEIKMADEVELLTDPAQPACIVSAPRVEEVEEVEEEEELEEGVEGEAVDAEIDDEASSGDGEADSDG